MLQQNKNKQNKSGEIENAQQKCKKIGVPLDHIVLFDLHRYQFKPFFT